MNQAVVCDAEPSLNFGVEQRDEIDPLRRFEKYLPVLRLVTLSSEDVENCFSVSQFDEREEGAVEVLQVLIQVALEGEQLEDSILVDCWVDDQSAERMSSLALSEDDPEGLVGV
jgi:hypothetical protein